MPLAEVDAWLGPYRKFWGDRLDALEREKGRILMPTPFHSLTSRGFAHGSLETHASSPTLRIERYLHHSIERVWAAITEPEQLVAWLAEAEIDLGLGSSSRHLGFLE